MKVFCERTEGAGERMRHALAVAGGNEVVAKGCGVSTSAMGRFMKGGQMAVKSIHRLAAFCRTTPEWILLGEGNAPAVPMQALPEDDRLVRHIAWAVLTEVSSCGRLEPGTAQMLARILARKPGDPPVMRFAATPASACQATASVDAQANGPIWDLIITAEAVCDLQRTALLRSHIKKLEHAAKAARASMRAITGGE